MQSDFRLISRISETGVVQIDVHGDLDESTADRLLNVLGVYREPITGCVVDLTGCDFVDSTGMRALMLCQMQLSGSHQLVVVGLQRNVAEAMSLAGMQAMLDIRPAREPA
jgi:anti-anti-sigma factor